jgi:hypothetical protein
MALAIPKSITFGDGLPILECDEYVGRFEIAMDDPFHMGVLDGPADLEEQLDARLGAQLLLTAVLG